MTEVPDTAGDAVTALGATPTEEEVLDATIDFSARELAAAAAASAAGSGGATSDLDSGTSFPVSPSSGDWFYRTDRNVLYFYNGVVTRWLTVDLKYLPFQGASLLDSSGTQGAYGRLPLFEDVYVEKWVTSSQVNTTNDGSNYYVYQLRDAAANVLAAFDTSGDAVNTIVVHAIAINTLYASSKLVLQNYAPASAVGTPGNHFNGSYLTLRIAG